MTAVDLKAAFGEPLRIERRADGSANWYYNFGTQQRESAPFSTSEITETERSHSFGETTTTTTTMSEAPIRISPSGRVTAPVPAGRIVVQSR